MLINLKISYFYKNFDICLLKLCLVRLQSRQILEFKPEEVLVDREYSFDETACLSREERSLKDLAGEGSYAY